MKLRRFAAAYFAVLALALLATVLRPVSFQKVNTIRGVDADVPGIEAGGSLDVERLMSSIPQGVPGEDIDVVWTVDPDDKHRRTILEGQGNCSNLVFGLARHLELEGVDYQIVHLIDPARFLLGRGHTVIRTRYTYGGDEHVGIVDVFGGGLPGSSRHHLDVADLERGPVPDFSFTSWGGRPERATRFYRDFLSDRKVVLGWISSREVTRYFEFVRWVHLPLGNERTEKYLVDGAAVLLGYYPSIYVRDLAAVRGPNRFEWTAFRSALWVFRSSVLVIPLLGWLAFKRAPRIDVG